MLYIYLYAKVYTMYTYYVVNVIQYCHRRVYRKDMKSATINIRVPEDVKEEAKSTYEQLGIDISTAINVFLRKSIEYGGFPFDVRSDRPNKETLEAIEESFEHPDKGVRFKNSEELRNFLNEL